MSQDILLICYRTENFDQLKIALEQAQIIVAQTEETKAAMPSLEKHSPTFLLLDFDIENAEDFLQEISESILINPPPYILIAAMPLS